MDRRTYLTTTGVALAGGLAGCLGDVFEDEFDDSVDKTDSPPSGSLATAISDDPETAIDEFESLVVTVEEIWLHPTADSVPTPSDLGGDGGENGTTDDEYDTPAGDDDSGGTPPGSLSLLTDDDGRVTFEFPEAAEGFDVRVAADRETGGVRYTVDEGTFAADGVLSVELVGDVSSGEGVTVEVTDGAGGVVSNADVSVGFTMPDTGPGKIRLSVDSVEVDLVAVRGDAKRVINEADLVSQEFVGLSLVISDDISFELVDGGEDDTSVRTPGNAPLHFNEAFEIRENARTEFTADFAPYTRGRDNHQGYILRPVPDESTVTYEPPLEHNGESNDE